MGADLARSTEVKSSQYNYNTFSGSCRMSLSSPVCCMHMYNQSSKAKPGGIEGV
jgi:hypothetical protein